MGVELLSEDVLGEWTQYKAVVGSDGVDGAALHHEPDNAAFEDQRLQLGRVEVDEP